MARSKNKSYKRVIGLSRRCNLKANSQYDERKGIQGLVLGALYQRFVQTNLCASPAKGGRRKHFVVSPAEGEKNILSPHLRKVEEKNILSPHPRRVKK